MSFLAFLSSVQLVHFSSTTAGSTYWLYVPNMILLKIRNYKIPQILQYCLHLIELRILVRMPRYNSHFVLLSLLYGLKSHKSCE